MFCESLFSFCDCLRILPDSKKGLPHSTSTPLKKTYQSITSVLDDSFSNVGESSSCSDDEIFSMTNSDDDLVIVEPESIQDYKNDS